MWYIWSVQIRIGGTMMKKILSLMLVTAVLLTLFTACGDGESVLADARQETFYYGFMDMDGNIVIEPALEFTTSDYAHKELAGEYVLFSDGLARVKADGKYGFIDTAGKSVIEPIYDDALTFQNGGAWVCENYRWGKIDTDGNYIVSPIYEDIQFTGDELVGFKLGNKWGYITQNGEVIVSARYDVISPFNEAGYAFVNTGLHIQIGALMEDTTVEYGQWYTIDTAGNVVNELYYHTYQMGSAENRFSDGLLLITEGTTDERFMYVDVLGSTVIDRGDNTSHPFSEGMAHTKMSSTGTPYYYISTSGDTLFGGYYYASEFREGFACVKPTVGDNYAFIDTSGSIAIAPQFESVSYFSEGLACVKKDGEFGYIDTSGDTVIDFRYSSATAFQGGLALADGNVINTHGEIILTPPEGYEIFALQFGMSEGLIPIIVK